MLPPTDVSAFSNAPGRRPDARVVWVGASSFEPRCTGSLTRLKSAGAAVTEAMRFDYASPTAKDEEAERLRSANRDEQERTLAALGSTDLEVVRLSGAPTSLLVRALERRLLSAHLAGQHVVLDISCFTRLHVIAIGSCLGQLATPMTISVVYTLPQNYTTMADRRPDFEGFLRVVIAPVVDGASLRSESRARGVILLSHENQRLLVALSEFEPAGGVIVQPITASRPDFAAVSRQRNRRIVGRLNLIGGWTSRSIPFSDAHRLMRVVGSQAEAASRAEGPLMLYPFGPKSLVFASALSAAQAYPEASWFVYPIPSFYDPFATEGVGDTFWASVTRSEGPVADATASASRRPPNDSWS